MKIVCYGDSNTYGWDPRSFSGNRYPHPWPELTAQMTGHNVINCGEPGRVIPCMEAQLHWFAEDVRANAPDLLMIMLGTNDLFYSAEATAERIAARMESMIRYAFRERLAGRILLLSCPHVTLDEAPLMPVLEQMSAEYRDIADRLQIGFADPFRWDIPMAYDGVHFTEEGHRVFAEKISKELC